MHRIVIYIFLFYYFGTVVCSINHIPVIRNSSLQVLGYNSTIINGTCQECLCAMLLNSTSINSFNCFPNNKTCEIFSNSFLTSSFLLINNSASSVYFISLPIIGTTMVTNSIGHSTNNFNGKLPLI